MGDIFYDDHYVADSQSDLEKFTDMLVTLTNAVWGKDWGLVSAENPTSADNVNLNSPHITYNLISRKHTKDRTVKMQQFHHFEDPNDEDNNITLYRTWFDCEVEFVIYSDTNKNASVWARRFEEFIETYKGYFKNEGVSEILFLEEKPPEINDLYNVQVPYRKLCYFIRIERITQSSSRDIDRVHTIVEQRQQTLDDLPQSNESEKTNNVYTHGNSDFMNLYNKHFPK